MKRLSSRLSFIGLVAALAGVSVLCGAAAHAEPAPHPRLVLSPKSLDFPIGGGTGSQFSLLPAQNSNANWVKVTQRVPVRIVIDEQPNRPLIAGLSVDATVDVSD